LDKFGKTGEEGDDVDDSVVGLKVVEDGC